MTTLTTDIVSRLLRKEFDRLDSHNLVDVDRMLEIIFSAQDLGMFDLAQQMVCDLEFDIQTQL